MANYAQEPNKDAEDAPDSSVATPPERSAWDHVLLARHPQRPHALDYISRLIDSFSELHGDRVFGDDPAIVCGFGSFRGRQLMAIGQQKGRKTEERVHRNFGMPRPEGYRKALRCMKLAEKFGRPIVTLLDTPGAYPGKDAEERGQAEAIARNLYEMSSLRVPVIAACIGEGGSGGALALGVGNRVLMMENAVYSVISPESCAAIVWRDSGKAALAANALKLTAVDLKDLGLVDEIVPEPQDGAQEDPEQAAALLGDALERNLASLAAQSAEELVAGRHQKFRSIGSFFEDVH